VNRENNHLGHLGAKKLMSRPGLALPFDGFDWDLEGNDWTQSRYNVFSSACMQLVVDMSSFAKKAGYLVTMAPAQTYFDVTTSKFNRFLNNSNEDG
jgi:chitinase